LIFKAENQKTKRTEPKGGKHFSHLMFSFVREFDTCYRWRPVGQYEVSNLLGRYALSTVKEIGSSGTA
jgi:hypothetical protein